MQSNESAVGHCSDAYVLRSLYTIQRSSTLNNFEEPNESNSYFFPRIPTFVINISFCFNLRKRRFNFIIFEISVPSICKEASESVFVFPCDATFFLQIR